MTLHIHVLKNNQSHRNERRMVVTRDSEWELGSDKILVKSIHFQCYKASSIDTW